MRKQSESSTLTQSKRSILSIKFRDSSPFLFISVNRHLIYSNKYNNNNKLTIIDVVVSSFHLADILWDNWLTSYHSIWNIMVNKIQISGNWPINNNNITHNMKYHIIDSVSQEKLYRHGSSETLVLYSSSSSSIIMIVKYTSDLHLSNNHLLH